DTNGCMGTGSVRVAVNPLPTITVNPNSSICVGSTIQLSASGGISYSWLPAAGLNDPHISNPVAGPSASTIYSVTVTDTLGCSSTATTTVRVDPLPVIQIIPNSDLCTGSTIQLYASGGNQYSWTPSSTLNDPNISNPVASPLGNTTYTVTVTDSNGCVNHASTQVIVHSSVQVITVPDQRICIGSATHLNASGGI